MSIARIIAILIICAQVRPVQLFERLCKKVQDVKNDKLNIHKLFEENPQDIRKTRNGGIMKAKKGNSFVAMKQIIYKKSETIKLHIDNELSITQSVKDNRCFPKLIECANYVNEEMVFLIFEFIEGDFGEKSPIYSAFLDTKDDFSRRMPIYKSMALCLKELHAIGILHNDLKPQNIMADSADLSKVKIIDFGLSSVFESEQSGGTIGYYPPELTIVKGEINASQDCTITPSTSIARDIYSLGVTFAVLEFGQAALFSGFSKPYSAHSHCFNLNAYQKWIKKQIESKIEQYKRKPDNYIRVMFYSVIKRMLMHYQEDRYSDAELIEEFQILENADLELSNASPAINQSGLTLRHISHALI